MKLFIFTLLIIAVIDCVIITLPTGSLGDINAVIARTVVVDGDILQLSSGVWTGCDHPINFMNKSITVRGESGVIIDCGGVGSAIHLTPACAHSSAVFENIQIINATNAIIHDGSCNLTLNSVDINHASSGLEAHASGIIVLNNCAVSDINETAILIDNGATVKLINSSIHGNNDAMTKACIYLYRNRSVVMMTASVVSNCRNGAVDIYYAAQFIAYDSIISMSSTRNSGGAIRCDSGSIDLNNVTIDKCTADQNGGAISIERGALSGDNLMIMNSVAGGDGGGVYARYEADLHFKNSKILFCTSLNGGGVYLTDKAVMYTSKLTISGCNGTYGGGISMNFHNNVTLESSYINTCNAQCGGAISVQSDGMLILRDTTVSSNVASDDGGGIYVKSIAEKITVKISQSQLNRNTAVRGGALYLYSVTSAYTRPTEIDMNDVDINNNIGYMADEYTDAQGAGVYMTENNVVSMNKVNMRRNQPGYGVYFDGGGVVISDSSTIICGNLPSQLYPKSRRSDFGNATICGVITSVTTSDDTGHILWPGADVTVDGTDMMINENDAIVQADIVTVEISSVPFTFTLPSSRTNVMSGALQVWSRAGVRSESSEDYTFMNFRCPMYIKSGPSPPRTATGLSNITTNIELSLGCDRDEDVTVSVQFDFGKMIQCTRVGSSYSCPVPPRANAGVVSFRVRVSFSEWFGLFIDTPKTFTYYNLPEPSRIIPEIAINGSTAVYISGVYWRQYGGWMDLQCMLEGKYIVKATTVNDDTISCTYYSSSPCNLNIENEIRVSAYRDDWSTSSLRVRHICNAMVTGGPSPSIIRIADNMTDLNVTASGTFYPSAHGACQFGLTTGPIVTPAIVMTSSSITCHVPYSPNPAHVVMEVTIDGSTFVRLANDLVYSNCQFDMQPYHGTDECVCIVKYAVLNDKTGLCDACQHGYKYETNDLFGECVDTHGDSGDNGHTVVYVASSVVIIAGVLFGYLSYKKKRVIKSADSVPLTDTNDAVTDTDVVYSLMQ